MKCKECEKAIKKAEGFQPCYEAAIAAQAARCKKHKIQGQETSKPSATLRG